MRRDHPADDLDRAWSRPSGRTQWPRHPTRKHARPGGGIPPSGLGVRGVGTTNLLHTHQKDKRTGPAILDASRSNDQPSRACFAATVAPCWGRGPRAVPSTAIATGLPQAKRLHARRLSVPTMPPKPLCLPR